MVNHNLHMRKGLKVASWLKDNGYTSLVEWGLDSDYCMDDNGVWYDDDGNAVDIFSQAYYAMEATNESV